MKKIRSLLIKALGVIICAIICLYNYSAQMRFIRELPNDVYIYDSGEDLSSDINIQFPFSISGGRDGKEAGAITDERLQDVVGERETQTRIKIDALGFFPVKTIDVTSRETVCVIPGGHSIGVQIHTDGILVVGLGDVESCSPAARSGIRAGDIIKKANGCELENASQLADIYRDSPESVSLTVLRGNREMTFDVTPEYDTTDGKYKLGTWVRDSTTGVGTLTFVLNDDTYFALGHAITDMDTGTKIAVRRGALLNSEVIGAVKGMRGVPGELKGSFNSSRDRIGTINDNTDFGISGDLSKCVENPYYPNGIPLGFPEQAHTGAATFLTTVGDEGIKEYTCNIIEVFKQSSPDVKSMVIEVTDEGLLEKTGGIVQGMSGSPIIQDGRLIGVITHVFINDPTKGYCLYAYWMYNSR